MPETAIRFAAKNSLDRRSGIWKCWANLGNGKNDVYVTNRATGKALKVSLHETGSWRIAFLSGFLREEIQADSRLRSNRLVDIWPRPEEISAGCTLALRIVIPEDAVTVPISDKDPRSTVWIPAPASGKALEVVLLLTAPCSNALGWPGRDSMGTQLLGSFEIENGYRVWMVYYVIDKPTMDTRTGVMTCFTSGKRAMEESRRHRAIIFSQATDGSRILYESNVEIQMLSQQSLKRAYEIEVFGEAVYAMAAHLARRPEHRRKWEALRQLEAQTRDRLRTTLARAGDTPHDLLVRSWLGSAVGAVIGVLPWRMTLTLLDIVLRWSVRFFERVEDEVCEKEGLSAYELAAHERAQWEFVRRELAGDEQSIDPILALLEARR